MTDHEVDLERRLGEARAAARSAAATAADAIERLQLAERAMTITIVRLRAAERVANALARYWRSIDPKIANEAHDAVVAWEKAERGKS